MIYLFIRFPASTATRILILGLVDGAFYALIAIGFSIIFGVSKMFKLSIGGYFVLGAFTARWLFFAVDVNATYVMDTHPGGISGIKYMVLVLAPFVLFYGGIAAVTKYYGVKVGIVALVLNYVLARFHRELLVQYYGKFNFTATTQAFFIQSSCFLLVFVLRYIEISKKNILGSYIFYNILLLSLSIPHFTERSPAMYCAILLYSMVFVAIVSMLIDRYLLDKARGNPTNILIITFGVAILIQSIIPMVSFPENGAWTKFDTAKSRLSLPGIIPKTKNMKILGASVQSLRVIAALVSIFFLILTFLFINKSTMGTAMRAVSQDPDAAWLMGINVRKAYMVSTGLGMALTALGAVLTTTYEAKPGWYIYMGYAPLILAIAVVTLGGLGSISGTAIAGFIIGMATTTISTINIQLSGVVPLIVILIIILLKPEGLFGLKEDSE